MALPQKSPGNAHDKRNSWERGKGSYSMRGELKRGIALRKRELNRKVRHSKLTLQHGLYTCVEDQPAYRWCVRGVEQAA